MWKRRELLGALGAGAAGLAFLNHRAEAAGQAPTIADAHEGHDPRHAAILKECDEACGHCEATCNAAFHHCISQSAAGKFEHAKMAQLVIDCAAFCTLSAAMIARHSELMVESCRACAEACHRCAEACGSAQTDAMMKACATACRQCEETCRKMVHAMGGDHHHSR